MNDLQIFGREHLKVNAATQDEIFKRFNQFETLLQIVRETARGGDKMQQLKNREAARELLAGLEQPEPTEDRDPYLERMEEQANRAAADLNEEPAKPKGPRVIINRFIS